MRERRWDAVVALASRQGGLVTRRQALDVGFPGHTWDRLVRIRSVAQVERGLYQVHAPPAARAVDLHTALLLCGDEAVVSHRAAARLHRLWGVDGFPLDVTAPRRLGSLPLTVMHHRGLVPAAERCRLYGVPVTSLERTIFDLAPILDVVTLASVIESARKRNRKVLASLKEQLPQSGLERDLRRTMQALIEDSLTRARPMDSPFEVQFWHRWPYTRVQMPVPQFEVRDQRGKMFIDFAWPQHKVGVETMGYETRQTSKSFDSDARRRARLYELGWLILEVTYTMFRNDFFGGVTRLVSRTLMGRRTLAV